MARDGSLLSVGAMAGFNSHARPAEHHRDASAARQGPRAALGRLRLPVAGDSLPLPRYNVAQTMTTCA